MGITYAEWEQKCERMHQSLSAIIGVDGLPPGPDRAEARTWFDDRVAKRLAGTLVLLEEATSRIQAQDRGWKDRALAAIESAVALIEQILKGGPCGAISVSIRSSGGGSGRICIPFPPPPPYFRDLDLDPDAGDLLGDGPVPRPGPSPFAGRRPALKPRKPGKAPTRKTTKARPKAGGKKGGTKAGTRK
jgi:hypothetical protein